MAESHISPVKPESKPMLEKLKKALCAVYCSLLPTKKDNFKQIAIKLLFIISIIVMIVSSAYLVKYFSNTVEQQRLVDNSREIWYDKKLNTKERFAELRKENYDFSGWLTVSGTNIDNPVYQHTDDSFYLNHDQRQQPDEHGTLYLSADDVIDKNGQDKNLVIYGHNMTDGTMFGTLKRYRNLDFFKKNPAVSFSTVYGDDIYKVFAVFLVDATETAPEDFDIRRSKFSYTAFCKWMDGVKERSIINTGVEVEYEDRMLTLVTCADDFENARLVVMARILHENEAIKTFADTAIANPSPRYPEGWYKKHSLEYPYDKQSLKEK